MANHRTKMMPMIADSLHRNLMHRRLQDNYSLDDGAHRQRLEDKNAVYRLGQIWTAQTRSQHQFPANVRRRRLHGHVRGFHCHVESIRVAYRHKHLRSPNHKVPESALAPPERAALRIYTLILNF